MAAEKSSSAAPKDEPAASETREPRPAPPPPAPNPESSDPPAPPTQTLAPAPAQPAAPATPTPPAISVPDRRSFSHLLAVAMGSPAASPRPVAAPILAVPVSTVPCFLSPAAMLDSPTFTGQFAMSHQEALASVTAQAQLQLQAAQQSPPPQAPGTPSTGDGYNWRKYGQKQVKSSDNSRSYYKCTDAGCSAKKKVERCLDGRVKEVMYRGQHSHEPPQQTRCSRERVTRPTGRLGENGILALPSPETNESDSSKKVENPGNGTPEQQLFCSSDCEGDTGIKTGEDQGSEPDLKRRIVESTTPNSVPSVKTLREHRVVVQATGDFGSGSDGYRWRKYGQKIVKGNTNPRSYYRCTHNGCPVRKHVEIASYDAKAIVITYEGEHNHDRPGSKSSCDPTATPLLLAAAPVVAVSPADQLQASDSKSEQKPSTKLPTDVDEMAELGSRNALESAQALLSVGCNPSTGESGDGKEFEGMVNPPQSENSAAVTVQDL